LQGKDPNPVLAGYFEKLFIVIVGVYPKETFAFMYNTDDGLGALKNMLANLNNQSVTSVLERCLNFTTNIFDNSKPNLTTMALDARRQLIRELLSQALDLENSDALDVLTRLQQDTL